MTLFARGRQATLVATALALLAMWSYPGGTMLDHSTHRYHLFQNFLSDLGMTVAYDGRANGIGALLFVASLTILVFGLGGALLGFVRLYTSSRARPVVRAAMFLGAVVALSFLGVAVTPENRVLDLHVRLTFFAFRVFPLVPLLLAIAYARNGTFLPSGVAGVECLLSSNRISSFLPACNALAKARRVLAVQSGIIGRRCTTVLMISGCPPSSAKLSRSCPSAHGFSG